MIDKLTVGMKSWIKQDYQDICECPVEYGISDVVNEFGKIVDIIEEDVNAKFELTIPRDLIADYLKEKMVKLIFLDIDGVLDTYKSRYQLDPVLMEHLGTLLERTGAKIVISSSWRSNDVAGTVEFMTDPENPSVGNNPFPFTEKVVGITPILYSVIDGDIDRPATRGEEIAAYLKEHTCDNYVILDDCDEMLRDQLPHLVLVNDEVGLTKADVEKAASILQ